MARDPTYVPPGSLVEVTHRTIQKRPLLQPSLDLNDVVYGTLGRAVEKYPVMGIVGFIYLPNQGHLLLLPPDAEVLAFFMRFVNANLSREIGRLRDWRGALWDGRYQSVVVREEEEAQVARLKHLIGRGVEENLVARPQDWPGPSSIPQLLRGGRVRGGRRRG